MLEAYGDRRQRELQEHGSVTALAVNDPKRLSELAPQSQQAQAPDDGEFTKWDWKEDVNG